jgi:hypothetical protein
MKKILILIFSFLMVICHAIPPPDINYDVQSESILSFEQQDIAVSPVIIPDICAQEVAFNYIGDYLLHTNLTYIKIVPPEKPKQMLTIYHRYQMLVYRDLHSINYKISSQIGSKINMQHTNYGYPLTANRENCKKQIFNTLI